jgi:NADPH:quinone reductase
MRAAVLEQFGEAFSVTTVDDPVPAADQVLVRIVASGTNPLDTKIAAGKAEHARIRLPAVLGMDLAGVVEDVGEDVVGFAPGDRVYGLTGGVGELQGSLAEYAAVDARLLAEAPAFLDLREAAALPLGVITAWEALVDRARVRSGQTVLVHGGAGGVGQMAVQLARVRGAQVFATGSPRSLNIIARLGAIPIDYTTPVEDYVAEHTDGEGFDVILDTVGGPVLDASFAAPRIYTGHVVSVLGWGTHSLAPLSFRGATYSGVFTLMPMLTGRGRAHHGEILRAVTALANAGVLTPILDPRRFTLDTLDEAHKIVATGSGTGKIVVDISDDTLDPSCPPPPPSRNPAPPRPLEGKRWRSDWRATGPLPYRN